MAKKPDHFILGIHVTDRMHNASAVQKVFTEYGCNIKTRLGLHDVSEDYCAPGGVVLLEIVGDKKVRTGMSKKLKAIKGLEIKEMVFGHD